MLVHDTHNNVNTEMAPEMGRRDQLPPYEQFWTIAKILANSQRIANLQGVSVWIRKTSDR